jgi:flagellar motor switch/type III secretory pathway protein FliN
VSDDPAVNPQAARYRGFESVPLRVTVKVGGARSRLADLMRLEPGDIVRLDRRIGEPFELWAGGVLLGLVTPVAEGEAIALKLVEVPEHDRANAG